MIIADPRRPAGHGGDTYAWAELIDLYSTLAELAGIDDDLSATLAGTSLATVVRSPDQTVKAAAFTQHQQPFYGSRANWQAWGYSLRTARWRYTQWRSLADNQVIGEELYDHDGDPSETVNLAGSGQHRQTLSQLRPQLEAVFPAVLPPTTQE